MKKSVAVISVFAVLALVLAFTNGFKTLTGYQALDLPEPPPPPGMESDQVTPTPTPTPTPNVTRPTPTAATADLPTGEDWESVIARLNALEDLFPAWEERLNRAEAQAAIAANVVERLDAMQSQIDALRVDVDNLKREAQRQYAAFPDFMSSLNSLEGASKRNAVISILLSVIALALVIGMIATTIVQHKREFEEDRKLIKNYVDNYEKAGYKKDSLRMHLRASGWKDWFIESALSGNIYKPKKPLIGLKKR